MGNTKARQQTIEEKHRQAMEMIAAEKASREAKTRKLREARQAKEAAKRAGQPQK